MATSTPALSSREIAEEDYTREPLRQQILKQLDRMIADPHFRNSKRYPTFLNYIVREAVSRRSDGLKERLLGIRVFDRAADYDTTADPVVRVTAGEVRKRLAQYYQSPGHTQEIRIEVPLGSYLPRFCWPEEMFLPDESPASEVLSEVKAEVELIAPARPRLVIRRALPWLLTLAGAFVILLLAVILLWSVRKPALSRGLSLFWQSSLRAPQPTLFVLGVHSFDEAGNDISPSSHILHPLPQQTLLAAMTQTDMVHLSDVSSYGALIEVLSGHAHSFRTQGAADTTLEELRRGPYILLGGFNNVWTPRLSQQLRFRFVTLDGGRNVIQDRDHPEVTWTLDTHASALSSSRDYGVVTRFLDSETDQQVLIVAGIGRCGTEAASDFVSTGRLVDTWLRSLPPHTGSNVEVVLATDAIEGKHGPPHVIAYTFW